MTAPRRASLIRLPTPPEAYNQRWASESAQATEQGLQDMILYIEGSNVQTPAALSAGDNDDYDPGLFTQTLRLTPDATNSAIAGLTNGRDGRRLRIFNIGTTTLTIKNEDAGSSAANRVTVPGAANIDLLSNDLIDLEYDLAVQRWRVVYSTGIIQQFAEMVPTLFGAAIQTPVDNDPDLTVGVYWTYQAATSPDYTMTVDLYRDELLVETVTGVDPAATQPYTVTDAGGGGLTGPHDAYVRVRLIRAADSAVIGDVFSSVVTFDGAI